MKQNVDHEYVIDIDDNDENIRKFSLNGEPLEYVDPSKIKKGDMVYWDKFNNNVGIVVANDRRDKYFQLFDVFHMESEKVQEVVEFQIYNVSSEG